MSHFRHTLLTIALATAALTSWAQTTAEQAQHQAHVLATEQASAPTSDLATPGSAGKMAAVDNKMKTMQEMHQKMMNAKTPEERQALMAERMKTMQEGMAMMSMMSMMGGAGMGGMQGQKPMPGNMKQRQQMLEKRMEMMETMMQMMMDGMPAPIAQ